MGSTPRPRDRSDFRVAIFCALPREADAIFLLFDDFWDKGNSSYGRAEGDSNHYTHGLIGEHNVVLAHLPGMGTQAAAAAAVGLRNSYTELKLVFLVGICGGVPRINGVDAFLGDVVISKSVVQYDYGRRYPHRFDVKDTTEDRLGPANKDIRGLLACIETEGEKALLEDKAGRYFKRDIQNKTEPSGPRRLKGGRKYRNRGLGEDRLYKAEYIHKHDEGCDVCRRGPCEQATITSCFDLGCQNSKLVLRTRSSDRNDDNYKPAIFIGRFGSGSTVMKSGEDRDRIAMQHRIIAFEMEGAGVWGEVPCLIVKGICDYADSHKDKRWQDFAAATAASVMKAILGRYVASDRGRPPRSQSRFGESPHCHTIPYMRNCEVVKRQVEVENLHQLLSNASACQAVALWGLGGSGKTQIALQYAYQRWDARDCSVFWVRADMEATFIQDYKTIARKLGLDDTEDEENLLEAVRDKIESLESWVLVLDNTDDMKVFLPGLSRKKTANLIRYIPQSAGQSGTVLWTSRDQRIDAIVGPGRAIEISRMTETEGRELLYTKWNKKDSGAKDLIINKLLEELEWLALAISQAGAFMRRTQIQASGYLSMLSEKKHRWELFKANETAEIQQTPGLPYSVLGTWHISIERIQNENQLAYHILNALAYVNNQNVSEKIMEEFAKIHGKRSPIDCKDIYDCDNDQIVVDDDDSGGQDIEILTALARLKEYSFIQIHRDHKKQKSYKMHKLVQDAARFGLSAGLMVDELRSGTSNRGEQYYAAMALKVMVRLFPGTTPGMWQQSEKYVEHAVQAAEWAEISGTPVRAAALLDRVCAFLADRSHSLQARRLELMEKSVSICQQALGGRHPDTLFTKMRLAEAYFSSGAKQVAKDLTNQVYTLQREVLGITSPDTLDTLSLKVEILSEEGKFEESDQLLSQAMRRCRVGGKGKSLAAAIILEERAWLSDKQGDYEKAAKLANSSLKIYQKTTADHPQMIGCMKLLVRLYIDIGRYSEAVLVGESALDLSEATCGTKHSTTNYLMHKLARSYFELEQYAKAEPLAKAAIRLGQDLPKIPDSLMRGSKRLLAIMSKLEY